MRAVAAASVKCVDYEPRGGAGLYDRFLAVTNQGALTP